MNSGKARRWRRSWESAWGRLSPGGAPGVPGRRGVALLAGGLAAAAVVVLALGRWRRRRAPAQAGGEPAAGNGHRPLERRSRSDPAALQALVQGSVSRVGFDLERLNTLKEANYRPLMEYLQYIQVQRGGSDTLVFVRTRDLDELAGMVGQSRDDFLHQFKKLGILLSMN
jgi:hypothetical protein